MHTPDPSPLGRSVSFSQFQRLRSLLQQMAETLGATLLTEELLLSVPLAARAGVEQFVLVASRPFSALLLGEAEAATYQLNLTFAPEAIAAFLDRLTALPHADASTDDALQQARAVIGVNDVRVQGEFTLNLITALTTDAEPALSPAGDSDSQHPCHLTEATLRQQIEQERLLNQVTTQIRQSLELPVILETAVEQVRQFLQADRLVIYRLDSQVLFPSQSSLLASEQSKPLGGAVIFESRSSTAIPSVINFSEAHCFVKTLQYQKIEQIEQQKLAVAVEDVEVRYAQAPCLLNFLHQAQIRSKLVAPIVVSDRLWGLLIAHQCFQPRQWQEGEQRFLQQIAGHLAIAISQAQLYAEVQEQKQTLEQRVIERTQELRDIMLAAQTANRAKSEFLATVSHELRTPLTCIIGMSATLLRWSKTALSERQQNFLQTIHDSGEHLLSLINDILDLSQAEAGKVVLNLSEFSLSHLAQQILKVFEGQSSLNDVELELDLRVDPKRDRFIADPRRLRQILFNLLGNAIKFTPEGGKVTLRLFTEEQLAIFQVKDTGIGIPEAQLPLLFQKFQQLDASYQRQYQGTGLGLALTKQLVELHGGSIEVDSTEGVGSVFTVRIPLQRQLVDGIEPLSRGTPTVDQPKGRIFLIEQDEETADVICDVLTAAGYQLVWILEGAAAIDQIEALRPVVVLISVQLPDTDGYSLIHRLRQNPTTKLLKSIALVPAHHTNEWRLAGADDYLVQPIRPEFLLQKVLALTEIETETPD